MNDDIPQPTTAAQRPPGLPAPAPVRPQTSGTEPASHGESEAALMHGNDRWLHLADRTCWEGGMCHPCATRRSTWHTRRLSITVDV